MCPSLCDAYPIPGSFPGRPPGKRPGNLNYETKLRKEAPIGRARPPRPIQNSSFGGQDLVLPSRIGVVPEIRPVSLAVFPSALSRWHMLSAHCSRPRMFRVCWFFFSFALGVCSGLLARVAVSSNRFFGQVDRRVTTLLG